MWGGHVGGLSFGARPCRGRTGPWAQRTLPDSGSRWEARGHESSGRGAAGGGRGERWGWRKHPTPTSAWQVNMAIGILVFNKLVSKDGITDKKLKERAG